MPDVSHVREELNTILPRYDVIRDCVEQLVKEKGETYLPRPNSADTSNDNKARYTAYLQRAVFYNVTARTLGGMAGEVFARDPVIEVPAELDAVEKDANGNGVDLIQEAKEAVNFALAYGRGGLFVDYPITDAPATKAQLQSGEIRPTINLYKPEHIINWRTLKRGSRHLLSLVVLSETWTKDDDGFKSTEEQQYRVLRLSGEKNNELYTVEIWREAAKGDKPVDGAATPAVTVDSPKDKYVIAEGPFKPTDANGKRLKEIPFTFIGAVNNDPAVDSAPLYDMAVLNVAHYRNSADYEESCYIVGQPTPYFTGLTQEWVTDVLKNKIPLGSRAAVPLPVDASAGLLQVEPNIMPKEAMEHKEAQMVALGAKLVEQKKVQRTATEANIANSSETSILATISKNVSKAYVFALEWCARFVGISESGIKFELNSDFSLANMSAEDRTQTVSEWQAGMLTFAEARAVLRKAGVATEDDEAAKKQIDKEMAESPAFANNPANAVNVDDAEANRELEREKIAKQKQQGGGGGGR